MFLGALCGQQQPRHGLLIRCLMLPLVPHLNGFKETTRAAALTAVSLDRLEGAGRTIKDSASCCCIQLMHSVFILCCIYDFSSIQGYILEGGRERGEGGRERERESESERERESARARERGKDPYGY